MALFSKETLDTKWRSLRAYDSTPHTILLNESRAFSSTKSYDIFLSHSYQDAFYILALKKELENRSYRVYVDWIEDNQLDRSKVDRKTAMILQERMARCKCLLYVASENATASKWMPWELGYFDALKDKVAILPLKEKETIYNTYLGQEYLGIYPYAADAGNQIRIYFWDELKSVDLREWIQ